MFVKQEELKNLDPSYSWLGNELEKTANVIEQKGFPCVFGVQGHKRKAHCYSALNYPYNPKELAKDIDSYLSELESMNIRDRGLSGLLVYFKPIGNMKIHAKQFMCWSLLNNMRTNYGIHSDENDSDPLKDSYSFKFKGELWFINFSSNSYKNRESRNLQSFITLAMQTLSKSDEYFNSDIEIKARAQKTVRNLAEKFDGCPVHSGLGPVIGSGKFSPAKLSYFIGDTNEEASFQPWKYSTFKPNKIIIDNDTLQIDQKSDEFINFQKLEKSFETVVLNKDISIDEIQKYNNLKYLFVSDNVELLEQVDNSISTCTFDKKLSLKQDCFHIEHFNDLLALYIPNELKVDSNA